MKEGKTHVQNFVADFHFASYLEYKGFLCTTKLIILEGSSRNLPEVLGMSRDMSALV